MELGICGRTDEMMSTWWMTSHTPASASAIKLMQDRKTKDRRRKKERAVAEVEALGAFHYGNALAFM